MSELEYTDDYDRGDKIQLRDFVLSPSLKFRLRIEGPNLLISPMVIGILIKF